MDIYDPTEIQFRSFRPNERLLVVTSLYREDFPLWRHVEIVLSFGY